MAPMPEKGKPQTNPAQMPKPGATPRPATTPPKPGQGQPQPAKKK